MGAPGGNAAGSDPAATTPYVWPDWYVALTKFQKGSHAKAVWQLTNTFLPYIGLWYLMVRSIQLGYPYALTLALAVPAAAFLVRIFIFFHDCVHGSFFSSKWANTTLGYLCGILTFTSFEDWRFSHLRHHVSYANLDARGFGDIWTLTLTEYQNSSKRMRFLYRLYRSPWVLFGLGAVFNFLLSQRFPTRRTSRKERLSVLYTNVLIACVIVAAAWGIGWKTYLLIQLPVLWLAGVLGIWLFYVQHQFEGVYWARRGQWDALRAAFDGSSFYDLPGVLRWFSGNIGYHYIHHLRPRIPNYNLKLCYESVPALQAKKPLTIRKSLSTPRLKLWDEAKQRLVGFP
jgi:omega-6 fatty acid desaturase (delta-12 desaturase)